MTDLVLISDGKEIFPANAEVVGPVFCLPGSTITDFEGIATLSITPEQVTVISPRGIEEQIDLWAIEDCTVIKVDGVLIERQTSLGPILSPLPYPHGIEISASMETRVRIRVRLITFAANAAHVWRVNIMRAARHAQHGILAEMMPRRRIVVNK